MTDSILDEFDPDDFDGVKAAARKRNSAKEVRMARKTFVSPGLRKAKWIKELLHARAGKTRKERRR